MLLVICLLNAFFSKSMWLNVLAFHVLFHIEIFGLISSSDPPTVSVPLDLSGTGKVSSSRDTTIRFWIFEARVRPREIVGWAPGIYCHLMKFEWLVDDNG